MNETPPRLLPEVPLPPYSYVPGRFPHPISDPKGHSFGVRPPPCDPPDPRRWSDCRPYLIGIDLFNHGFYWEAHEVWESIWHACGRKGETADFIKGLIKLAAAGVKVRQGQPRGARNHARRAGELFARVGERNYMGLDMGELVWWAEDVADQPPTDPTGGSAMVVKLFPWLLRPG